MENVRKWEMPKRLKFCEHIVQKGIFGCKRNKETEKWRNYTLKFRICVHRIISLGRLN
jgi:hypothetical protein